MKTETCVFSGHKIYPGHGKRSVRADGKVNIFINKKCERSMKMRRNPRDTAWTIPYRRKHKKGVQAEEVVKRKVKKVQKFQRAIGIHSVADLMAKRNQKPEFRRAQREQAVKAAKEKTREQKAVKKAEKLKTTQKVSAAAASKQKAAKPMKTQAPRVTVRR